MFTSFESDDPVRILTSAGAFFGGSVIGWVAGSAAGEEVGVAGHGNGVPTSVPKHHVALVEPPPDDLPELVCEKCGHEEEFPWGSHYRRNWVEKQYLVALERFEQHACP